VTLLLLWLGALVAWSSLWTDRRWRVAGGRKKKRRE
jgi:hypothetical protein